MQREVLLAIKFKLTSKKNNGDIIPREIYLLVFLHAWSFVEDALRSGKFLWNYQAHFYTGIITNMIHFLKLQILGLVQDVNTILKETPGKQKDKNISESANIILEMWRKGMNMNLQTALVASSLITTPALVSKLKRRK